MSTQINVTVGSGGLSDKARQLQTAARQAKLEGDRLAEVEDTAKASRDQRLAQLGLSPQGVSLYAPDPRLPQIERRPAAYRIPGVNFGELYYRLDFDAQEKVTITLYSQDGTASLIDIIEGTEKPEGYRDRAGADKLSYINPEFPETGNAYLYETTTSEITLQRPNGDRVIRQTSVLLEHTGVTIGSDQVFQTTARNANTGGWAEYFSDSDEKIITIPVGKQNAILIYLHSRYSGKSYSLRQRTKIMEYDESSLELTLLSYVSTTTIEANESTTNEVYAAYLVGLSTVRKITVPQQFINQVKDSSMWADYRYTAQQGTGTSLEYIGPGVGYVEYTFTGIDSFLASTSRDYLDYQNDFNDEIAFIGSWGLPYASDLRFNVSPGIYTVLQAKLDQQVPYPILRETIKSYILSAGKEYRWMQLATSSSANRRVAEQYYGELPIDYFENNQFDSAKFKKIKTYPVYSPLPTGVNKVFWVDWNSPGYCTAQAKALGFTDADLTP